VLLTKYSSGIKRNEMDRHEKRNKGGFGGFPSARETTCKNEAYASG
jgi:hypothetical protein